MSTTITAFVYYRVPVQLDASLRSALGNVTWSLQAADLPVPELSYRLDERRPGERTWLELYRLPDEAALERLRTLIEGPSFAAVRAVASAGRHLEVFRAAY